MSIDNDNNNSSSGLETPALTDSVVFEGYLYKWTNYYHGWKKRYVILTARQFSYYKSKEDVKINCNGSLSVSRMKVVLVAHDECRFDVLGGETYYFFKADDVVHRNLWTHHIELARENLSMSANNHSSEISRAGSIASLVSTSSSGESNDSNITLDLNTSLIELERFKNQIYTYIDSIKMVYEALSDSFSVPEVGIELNSTDDEELAGYHNLRSSDNTKLLSTPKKKQKNAKSKKKLKKSQQDTVSLDHSQSGGCACMEKIKKMDFDFVNQTFAFRAAASGFQSTVLHCIELINDAQVKGGKSVKEEREKKHKLAKKYKELRRLNLSNYATGPDYAEGPHSMIHSDEFYDALETAIDIENEKAKLQLERLENNTEAHKITLNMNNVSLTMKHRFSQEAIIEFAEAENFLTQPIGEDGAWELSSSDGNTKVYKKTLEIDNIVMDPYRLLSIYQGVTSEEVAQFFWDPNIRLKWDVHVDEVNVLEWLNETSCVVHQLQKHVWPAARRDCCFYSEIKRKDSPKLGESILKLMMEERKSTESSIPQIVGPSWMVVNFSVEHPQAISNNCVRALAKVGLICQTFTDKPGVVDLKTLTRNDIYTRIHYFASINPGGWLPAAAVRSIARREFPKFVKNLGNCIFKSVSSNPIVIQ